MNHIYFTATLEAAKWGAELAVALSNTAEIQDERIYIVEPLGEFENDPNVTDKSFQESYKVLSVESTFEDSRRVSNMGTPQ